MLVGSFRLVAAHLIPRQNRCKQALLLGILILAGCGGSAQEEVEFRSVAAAGYAFDAPRDWTVSAEGSRTTAKSGSDMAQVTTFPLVRAYRPSLFTAVEAELRARMEALAKQTGGSVGGHRTVLAGGVKSHSYRLKAGDREDVYTFVLRGKREYQLVCAADAKVCGRFVASFRAP
jgi:hypothetical protein